MCKEGRKSIATFFIFFQGGRALVGAGVAVRVAVVAVDAHVSPELERLAAGAGAGRRAGVGLVGPNHLGDLLLGALLDRVEHHSGVAGRLAAADDKTVGQLAGAAALGAVHPDEAGLVAGDALPLVIADLLGVEALAVLGEGKRGTGLVAVVAVVVGVVGAEAGAGVAAAELEAGIVLAAPHTLVHGEGGLVDEGAAVLAVVEAGDDLAVAAAGGGGHRGEGGGGEQHRDGDGGGRGHVVAVLVLLMFVVGAHIESRQFTNTSQCVPIFQTCPKTPFCFFYSRLQTRIVESTRWGETCRPYFC